MLLANKRLPYGNQILAQIMPLLKSILGKIKFLSKKNFKCVQILLAGAAVPLFKSYKLEIAGARVPTSKNGDSWLPNEN